jgi:hypothetical protein
MLNITPLRMEMIYLVKCLIKNSLIVKYCLFKSFKILKNSNIINFVVNMIIDNDYIILNNNNINIYIFVVNNTRIETNQ